MTRLALAFFGVLVLLTIMALEATTQPSTAAIVAAVIGTAGCLLAIIGSWLPGWLRFASLFIGLAAWAYAFLIAQAMGGG